jgi:PAS domain S-box-containing protein
LSALSRVLLFNPACEQLFGYRAEEVIGREVKMLMPFAA